LYFKKNGSDTISSWDIENNFYNEVREMAKVYHKLTSKTVDIEVFKKNVDCTIHLDVDKSQRVKSNSFTVKSNVFYRLFL
jgi:hypothetical protein